VFGVKKEPETMSNSWLQGIMKSVTFNSFFLRFIYLRARERERLRAQAVERGRRRRRVPAEPGVQYGA